LGLEPIRLTSREYDVLVRLSKQNKDIAKELGTTVGLVNKYYYYLSAKLNATTRTEVVIKALKEGLVDIWDFIT